MFSFYILFLFVSELSNPRRFLLQFGDKTSYQITDGVLWQMFYPSDILNIQRPQFLACTFLVALRTLLPPPLFSSCNFGC